MSQQQPPDETAVAPSVEAAQLPKALPVLPIKDFVVFPGMILPVIVAKDRDIKLVDHVLVKDRLLVLAVQKDPQLEVPRPSDLFLFGVAAVVMKMLKFPDNTTRILVQGIARIELTKFTQTEPFLMAEFQKREETSTPGMELEALFKNAQNLFQKLVGLAPNMPDELKVIAMNIKDPGRLADMICANLNVSIVERQKVLEALDIKTRLERVLGLLTREVEVLELSGKIQSQVQSQMGKTQREYYLREQLKAIQKELGEGDEQSAEIEELRAKIKEAKMPPEALKEAERELDRLSRMHPSAAEYTVSRTYIDWLVTLPWSKATQDNLDIKRAHEILEEDHYDLQKVKERILEYLSVRKLKADMKGPILCFVGPPGVGKTSLGKSIARALGRKFIRMSLGGVRDEAEIRGHRRTYVGALPGRIIQGIRTAGSNNPVFMLDEVDKLGSDFRGDPSSALLEVLDPEQNFSFSDHYLDVPFDLSKVMFITTANILDTIPPPLRDRMEVLELPGYTEEEKLSIAKKYLVPKQREAHGLTDKQIEFEDAALQRVAADYTREAGLRNLEREIANICRKVARKVAEGAKGHHKITAKDVPVFLGPIKFFPEVAERTAIPGVATGLAWTAVGGDILFIESTQMPGSGKLMLTGSLGDVMKESAEAAVSFIRSRMKHFGIPEDLFKKIDLHIHVPSGAIPKDGPSAGVTICMSLLSLLTNRPVRPDVAMTGEITLRGA
ncbi:MAG: endopeptidase La, partial [Planctomycetes bacterium]|nr:endopeptidase La [Planctomycetota bacterium]